MKEADANMKSIWNTEWLSMQMGDAREINEQRAAEDDAVVEDTAEEKAE